MSPAQMRLACLMHMHAYAPVSGYPIAIASRPLFMHRGHWVEEGAAEMFFTPLSIPKSL